jgi:Tfp pilus assembly protein PilX
MRPSPHKLRLAARSQDGFSLIITLGVMLITSLLLVAAFTADGSDVSLSHEDLTQKQAYNAAMAGIQNYEYRLQVNPDFWETCESLKAKLPQEGSSSYEVKLLAANTSKGSCSTTDPFEYAIESSGRAANTFNVESTGYAGKDKRSLVATFGVNGFLNYVYFTHYEDEDPLLHPDPSNPEHYAECKQFHAKRVEEAKTRGHGECGGNIEFAPQDAVKGPMHTDDAALVCGKTEFGRKEHVPADKIEINKGIYSEGCTSEPVFYPNVPPKGYTVGEELIPPESDTSLEAYVESGYEFEGATTLELEGKYVWVTNPHYEGGTRTKISLPKNGLIYVRSTSSPACTFEFEQEPADTSAEVKEEAPCGTVYLKGNYAEALTIASEKDIVIKGNVIPTGVTPPASGSEPGTPANTVTLGLIASGYVRMWHPCTRYGEEGLKDPWIYAAILSTGNSFLVDNYACGNSLGDLNIFGAIAQNFRGIVGTSGNTGYIKNYNYDERLATDEPPYFLAPLKAGWKVTRVTAPTGG